MFSDKFAFVFPGQGSQSVGMLGQAHERFDAVRETFDEAGETLDYDVWDTVCNGPQETLNLTEVTQPVLLCASVALWRAWLAESGPMPALMAGHSLGEFSALVCAGSLEFRDALRLVRKRGEFMQSAVPVGEGSMAAIIGLEDAVVQRVCNEVAAERKAVLAPVNFNSPGQVVIAGHRGAVDEALEKLAEAGARRAVPLAVSAPFHTELMRPAGERLAEELASLHLEAPRVPVVHNVHARTENDPERIRQLLVEQIYSPVQWTGCIERIVEEGVTHLVECGPGTVLSGLTRRIDRALKSFPLEDPEALLTTRSALS